MNYYISYDNALTHYVKIVLEVINIEEDSITLELPSWRPGKYEIADFAKNMLKISAVDDNGSNRLIKKLSKSKWLVDTVSASRVQVEYLYYAYEMDAGNSWLDEEQLYLNFVNCMVYVRDRMNIPHTVHLDLPDSYSIACGLQKGGNVLYASSYYQLADSPMIASKSLAHYQYSVKGVVFNIWIQGSHSWDIDQLLADFKLLTKNQVEVMVGFPCRMYHFLIHALPYTHYHGVEHGNSTVVTLGPAQGNTGIDRYDLLLGICSHELFHVWNVVRIRPKELLPYDFSKEVYFDSGYVAEGFTTYYGDLFLVTSGVKSSEWFLKRVNKMLLRYCENFGRENMSIAESSFDLWLDGYSGGIPNRKVSIYNEGALIAMAMDMQIRVLSSHENSLDDIVRGLWMSYGSVGVGYESSDLLSMLENLTDHSWQSFFENYIYGTIPLTHLLSSLAEHFGYTMVERDSEIKNESHWGFRVNSDHIVVKIQPESIAEQLLSLGDEIKNLDEALTSAHRGDVQLEVVRNHKLIAVKIGGSSPKYFKFNEIVLSDDVSADQNKACIRWLNQ